MVANIERISQEFSLPPEADFLSYCADGLLLARDVYHREIPGFTYDPQTGFYEEEKQAIDEVLTACKEYMNDDEMLLVRKAIALTALVRADQYRDSGEPYLLHDLFIMSCLVKHKLDVVSVVSGGLHDTVEDTQDNPRIEVTVPILEQFFGVEVAGTVRDLTKFRSRRISGEMANEPSRLTTILALFDNVRVTIIKTAADRLHNMLTLGSKKSTDAQRTITETQLVYIPLARLMGLFEEAALLEYLCIFYDYREDQDRLGSINERHGEITSNLNERAVVEDMFEQVSMHGLTHREHPCTVAAMYRDSEARFYINVDISLTKALQGNGIKWGEDAWKILRRFIWETDTYNVEMEGNVSEFDFRELIKNDQTDSLSFWVTRVSDGMRFHIHVYPQDVYEREEVPLTYLYRSPVGEGETFDWIQGLAHIKHTLLARRLERIVGDFGSDQASADTLLRELAPRLADGVMSVVGVDKRGTERVWRMREGSTVLDYARSIAPSNWTKATSVEVNGEQVPFDYILSSHDKIHIHFSNTRQYDPLWLHSFQTDVGGREELREAILKQLQEYDGFRRNLIDGIKEIGATQMNQCLPSDEQPFRYGLLEPDIRPFVLRAVESVRQHLRGTQLEGLITSRSRGHKKMEDLFYFGVGMRLIYGSTLEEIMKRAQKHNRNVQIIRVAFSKSLKGQVEEVAKILKEHNINILDIETSTATLTVRFYLRPNDRRHEERIHKAIGVSRQLRHLSFASIAFGTVGNVNRSSSKKKRKH